MTWPIIAKFQNIFWWISFQHVSMIFSWVQNRHWTVVEFLIKYGSYVLTFWENHSSFKMDAQRYVIKLLKYVWPHESEPLLSIDSFSIMIECVCCEWIEGHFFGFDHFKGYSCWLNRGMETFFLAKYVINLRKFWRKWSGIAESASTISRMENLAYFGNRQKNRIRF